MNKEIILMFDSKDGVYRNSIIMEKEFVLFLKDNGFLKMLSSFEDIPSRFPAEILIKDQDLTGVDCIQVCVSTLIPLPESWKKDRKKNLNLDLINNDTDVITFSFFLGLECIAPYSNAEYLLIEIPM